MALQRKKLEAISKLLSTSNRPSHAILVSGCSRWTHQSSSCRAGKFANNSGPRKKQPSTSDRVKPPSSARALFKPQCGSSLSSAQDAAVSPRSSAAAGVRGRPTSPTAKRSALSPRFSDQARRPTRRCCEAPRINLRTNSPGSGAHPAPMISVDTQLCERCDGYAGSARAAPARCRAIKLEAHSTWETYGARCMRLPVDPQAWLTGGRGGSRGVPPASG